MWISYDIYLSYPSLFIFTTFPARFQAQRDLTESYLPGYTSFETRQERYRISLRLALMPASRLIAFALPSIFNIPCSTFCSS